MTSMARVGEATLNAAFAEAIALAKDMDSAGDYFVASPLQSTEWQQVFAYATISGSLAMVHSQKRARSRRFLFDSSSSIEAALEYAKRHPGARVGSVEVPPRLRAQRDCQCNGCSSSAPLIAIRSAKQHLLPLYCVQVFYLLIFRSSLKCVLW